METRTGSGEAMVNRRRRVAGALMMNLPPGALYAWSIFVLPLEKEFGWTRTQTSWVFTIAKKKRQLKKKHPLHRRVKRVFIRNFEPSRHAAARNLDGSNTVTLAPWM